MNNIYHFSSVILITFLLLTSCTNKDNLPYEHGVFQPTDESLSQYQYPKWFRDAKFGIWAHWGPQAVPRQGDWYARNMYQNNNFDRKKKIYTGKPHRQNIYHTEHYGHPSVFGYKDILPLWKAERWDPDSLMRLFKKAGARYFVSMAVHHDNFFLWNSNLHRWNSVKVGPHKDVVALWQKAAQKEGLKFGVSEHLAASYTWFQTSKRADDTGDKKGVPYDGNNPEYEDLYHKKAAPDDTEWLTKDPEWHLQWYQRIKELLDMYQPDLLYSDSKMPFGDVGRTLVAHFYNQNIKNNNSLEAVYTCKEESNGRFVHDVERGIMKDIQSSPWQTDSSIGDWFYRTGQKYKTSKEIIQMLIDIVSKNGNLLLNVVQTPEGDIEPDIIQILNEIGEWMAINGEGIYETRPWILYGEGPSTIPHNQEKGQWGGLKEVRKYQWDDIRYTQKDNVVYAFCLNYNDNDLLLKAFGNESDPTSIPVKNVQLLGTEKKIKWEQTEKGLYIYKDIPHINDIITFKISL